jgi:hypothetical protein
MDANDLDTCTKRLVGSALIELRRAVGRVPNESKVTGELAQRVREIIAREATTDAGDSQSPVGLAEELALSVYLTVAAQESSVELEPELLLSLQHSLNRVLEGAHQDVSEEISQ